MKKRIVTTGDGSQSVAIDEWDEQYHSRHGARQESEHVFIETGLKHVLKHIESRPIRILEVGFGTGLNALLTAEYSQQNSLKVDYTGLEAFPLESEIVSQLNYGSTGKSFNLFSKIHETPWETGSDITSEFNLKKLEVKIEEWSSNEQFHLCYYDAFAPRVQPELWTKPVFKRIHNHLCSGGVLVTYCAKGQVRRDMESVGFKVERLPGPPGKREMLRATK